MTHTRQTFCVDFNTHWLTATGCIFHERELCELCFSQRPLFITSLQACKEWGICKRSLFMWLHWVYPVLVLSLRYFQVHCCPSLTIFLFSITLPWFLFTQPNCTQRRMVGTSKLQGIILTFDWLSSQLLQLWLNIANDYSMLYIGTQANFHSFSLELPPADGGKAECWTLNALV